LLLEDHIAENKGRIEQIDENITEGERPEKFVASVEIAKVTAMIKETVTYELPDFTPRKCTLRVSDTIEAHTMAQGS